MHLELKLGNSYSVDETTFRVFCTNADKVQLRLYDDADSYRSRAFEMNKTEIKDIYEITIYEDLDEVYYDYIVTRKGVDLTCTDPYAISSSANSRRSVVINLDDLKIVGFDKDQFVDVKPEHAIIYETHIRDMSVHESGQFEHEGKLLALCENTGNKSGIGYINYVGYTHVHYLPIQDFYSVDELSENQYNWGYDPENYFVIEGSYSTDATDPKARILEMQQMIKAHHDLNLGVILDVVYNHVYRAETHAFSVLAPEVYFRWTQDGRLSNGSGCGNELNTEHEMVRHLIVESLKHLAKTYHIDGFRFDLMGLIDKDTMQQVYDELQKINQNVILYGEPWTGGESVLDFQKRCDKSKPADLPVSVFNDDFRNALKGDNDGTEIGFLQGDMSKLHNVLTGIAGSIDYNNVHIGFAKNPYDSINYISSHDNLILYDKFKLSTDYDDDKIMQITGIGFAILLLSFGIPFIQAGTDFMRSKKMNHNSYNAPDSINAIDWNYVEKNKKLVEFMKSLIKLRKDLKFFGDYDANDIKNLLEFKGSKDLVSYRIYPKNEDYECIHIIINPQDKNIDVKLCPDQNIIEIFRNTFIEEDQRKITSSGDGIFKIEPYEVLIFKVLE